ncbi:hypothetical protein CC85DRAFT_287642 [Cutaneotrichosporon oleaginosum]|uniref:Uncharacterized protein n=1 Tax=Cutaneotrichosporon oleaginosum TaxID=879819 RepID=A0A0J0XGX4_9TREE|nr:uncharacterized protein CC85DRAFT_287642 [Cutaneotrichosporon oleaginosum]KLT40316.1 hypothetical protein CC85DRAFT_287642 [Cutaneotrichosporon oleaginosum]TXT07973.1 hypothetical protein COLE_04897 [Cutaneotrichosporon oleaginosum]
MASGWDTPRLRQRPAFLTPKPTQPAATSAPLGEVDNNLPTRSPWPKTPSVPWYDRPSPSSATSSSGLSAPSAPSGPSGQTTSSTIQYLRLAFQETPPQLKELEEGWRIARRAASRPAPIVVVEREAEVKERIDRTGGRELRSALKGERDRVRHEAERVRHAQTDSQKHSEHLGDGRLEPPAKEREMRASKPPREPSDGLPRARRDHRTQELGVKRRGDLFRLAPDPPLDKGKQRALPETQEGGSGQQRAKSEEHSVGQSTGLLTPPTSPAPLAVLARLKRKDTSRLPVRFVSPTSPSSHEPQPGPSGAFNCTSGSSQPSQPTPSSSVAPEGSLTPTKPVPTLRVMSVAIPRDTPPIVQEQSSPLSPPEIPPHRLQPAPQPAPTTAPGTSRPAPATLRPGQGTAVNAKRASSSNPDPTTPKPIRVHPLPLTRHPEALSRKSSDTIVVHPPTAEVALTLNLRRQTAQINRVGDEVTIEGRAPQCLRLADSANWSAAQRDLWQLLARLVAEYKRRTPRVKVFTALGELVVTCCEPPDIVLSYLVSDETTTKVRLRYSLSSFEAILDTSTRRPRGTRDETHRARRSIPLRWSGQGERAALALGVDFADWDSAEKDAVRRLWALREDWARFVPGYEH